jgi:hypothetical protein
MVVEPVERRFRDGETAGKRECTTAQSRRLGGGEREGRGARDDTGDRQRARGHGGAGRLEVGETPDRWVPPVGERE